MNPATPVWDEARIREHLRFLNRDEMQGRATATPGGAAAASYIAARMEEARLQPAAGENYRMLYYIPVNDSLPAAINMAGYVAGKNPALVREAVIVCTHYDGPGQVKDETPAGTDQLGTGVAALLELARHYSSFSRFTNLPDRTILFAAWSGSLLNHAGLRAYLDRPIWPASGIRVLIYIGLRPEEERNVRQLVERMGIRFISVPVQNTIGTDTRIMALEKTDRSTALAAARVEALRLIEAAFPVINAEVVTIEPPMAGTPLEIPKVPVTPAE